GSDKIPLLLDTSEHNLTVPVVVQAFEGIDRCLLPARLEPELAKVRRHLAFDLGVPFPGLVMRPMARFTPGNYVIYVNEIPVQSGEVRPDHLLALEPELELKQARIAYANGGTP